MEAMTWAQLFVAIAGVVVAAVGIAVAVWFGFLSRQDRGFDRLGKQIEAYETRNETDHRELRKTLQTVDGNVRELVGRFKERDQQQAAAGGGPEGGQ